jgi:hypothetical protein
MNKTFAIVFMVVLFSACRGGGVLSGPGTVSIVDTADLNLTYSYPAITKKWSVAYLVANRSQIPDTVRAQAKVVLPGQAAMVRAPEILGSVEAQNLHRYLIDDLERGLRPLFERTEVRDSQPMNPAPGSIVFFISFAGMKIDIDALNRPVFKQEVSSCNNSIGSKGGDMSSESTTLFGPVPIQAQRAYLRLDFFVKLMRGESLAEGASRYTSYTLSGVGESRPHPRTIDDLEEMFEEALEGGMNGIFESLPIALGRLEEPELSIEELIRKYCS